MLLLPRSLNPSVSPSLLFGVLIRASALAAVKTLNAGSGVLEVVRPRTVDVAGKLGDPRLDDSLEFENY